MIRIASVATLVLLALLVAAFGGWAALMLSVSGPGGDITRTALAALAGAATLAVIATLIMGRGRLPALGVWTLVVTTAPLEGDLVRLEEKSVADFLAGLSKDIPWHLTAFHPDYKMADARPTPPDYLVHTEWDSPELAKLGFAKVLVNHRIRKIHDDGVMAHLIKGPYIKFFRPMMEEPGWRDHLR